MIYEIEVAKLIESKLFVRSNGLMAEALLNMASVGKTEQALSLTPSLDTYSRSLLQSEQAALTHVTSTAELVT